MKKRKSILVICALGYATSTIIKQALTEYLRGQKLDHWSVDTIGLNMARDYEAEADLIVSSLELKQEEHKVPVINGVALISGIGKEAVLEKIGETIRELDGRDA